MTIAEQELKKGTAQAREITRVHAKTFYFASFFLPAAKRTAAYSVYAVCRISDDAVDQSPDRAEEKIAQMQQNINNAYSQSPLEDPILKRFRKTIETYRIPKRYFDDLIDGIRMDLSKARYADFKELYEYCYKVAGVVGLIMLEIFGYKDPAAKEHAVELGIAMQLTNILRDVREDYERGRIYLPKNDLEKFSVSEDSIAQSQLDENFSNLLKFQIDRAREYYRLSNAGIPLLQNRRTQFVVALMKDMYAGILGSIEENQYDVFTQRAHLNFQQKIMTALRIFSRRSYI